MMQRPVRVVAVTRHGMQVATRPEAACSACAARQVCAEGASGERVFELPRHHAACTGDWLWLGIPARRLVMLGLIAYALPALALLLGAWFGQTLGHSEDAAVGGAAAGLFAGLLLARGLALRNPHTLAVSPCADPASHPPRSSSS